METKVSELSVFVKVDGPFEFPVVTQYYDIDVIKEFAIRGNAALMKCQIPSFVADFVGVVSWHTDQNEDFYPLANPDGKSPEISKHARSPDRLIHGMSVVFSNKFTLVENVIWKNGRVFKLCNCNVKTNKETLRLMPTAASNIVCNKIDSIKVHNVFMFSSFINKSRDFFAFKLNRT